MTQLLVVDDEANIRLLYAQELSDEGYQVVTAGSALEAVEKLQSNAFDLVVLDIKLKNESGIELLQRIVKERHNLPVILCTAFSCYKDDFSAWLADGYVVKSSDMQELKDEIKRVLAKRQKAQTAG
ncbi:two-component system response regulator [Geomonas silvestris]|uniref:Two-component system response regulator n=1 Tax=Geomonas silvestris TaxID=2740184 RepID=A0A6V8MMH1_9BACT|nr:response regulator [Geomonas silvestris]GFO60859.1 two-component system response regulator [Geomonas silvestris]